MPHTQNFDVIIIGAGIGGLTCGNILVKNGMKVLILEKNPTPGGAVSTFYRNGYPIDISHSLSGAKEGSFIRKVFDYLDIYKKLEFIELEKAFIYFPRNSNEPIPCYTDLTRYKKELTKHFPQEAKNIENFFNTVSDIWEKEVLKSYYNPTFFRLLSYPFLFKSLFRYKDYTFDKFLNRFTKNNSLKELISVSWPFLGVDRFKLSALYAVCVIMSYHKEKSYFVKGGFGKIPQVLASRFEELGGKILYNTEAERIVMGDKGVCRGVKAKNGNVYSAKKIISNSDSKKTFLELVDKKFLPRGFLNKIKKLTMSSSAIQVHLIVKAEIDKKFLSSGIIHLDLEETVRKILHFNNADIYSSAILSINPLKDFIDTKEEDIYAFNLLWMPAHYNLWERIISKFGQEEYENIKREIAQLIIVQLKKIFHFEEVKLSHVLTPISFANWLNSTKGAIYDTACFPSQVLINRLKFHTPITNLYLVGAKTFPGHGITGAIYSAVSMSDILLKRRLTKGKFVLN